MGPLRTVEDIRQCLVFMYSTGVIVSISLAWVVGAVVALLVACRMRSPLAAFLVAAAVGPAATIAFLTPFLGLPVNTRLAELLIACLPPSFVGGTVSAVIRLRLNRRSPARLPISPDD